MRLNHRKLHTLIQAMFQGSGCKSTEAQCISDHLIRSNLLGHDSHGVIRTPIYLGWLREGKLLANRRIKIIFDSSTMALIDGQLGFGHSIGQQSVRLGIEKCRSHGVAVIALRNSGHLGRIGNWAEMAIDAQLVSLHFVNTSGQGINVVPFGGTDARMSVNPIVVGIPAAGNHPIVLDIAAAATAEGKLKVARNKGVRVPDGQILDGNGQPTNDPMAFYGPPRGVMLPFGEHKGSGLGFCVELLAGALSGGGCTAAGKTRLEQGMLSIFIDPLRLQSEHDLFSEISRYVEFVKSARPAIPGDEILIPGEIEQRCRTDRLANGIEVDRATWNQLVKEAEALNIPAELLDIASDDQIKG